MSVVRVDNIPGRFDDAACAGKGDVMYPKVEPGANSGMRDPYSKARKICAVCPCVEECKEYAIGLNPKPEVGMFGGLTPTQIRKERYRRFREKKNHERKNI